MNKKARKQLMALASSMESAGLTMTDLLLSLDTKGFQRIGDTYGEFNDATEPERTALIRRSRLYDRFEPLPDRMNALWTQYTFSRPWQLQAEDEAFQPLMERYFGAAENYRQYSATGWQDASHALLVDGERWYAYFMGNVVRARKLDPLEMADVLTNPDDRDEIWYYRRTFRDSQGTLKTRFYRDWNYQGNAPHPRMSPDAPGAQAWGETSFIPEPGVEVTYLAINTMGLRGFPLLTSAFDWIRAQREFMRDRSALSTARAQFAMKATVKGGAAQVGGLKSAFEQPDVYDGGRTARASTFVSNPGVELAPMEAVNDGASAVHDGRSLRNMAALPSGLPDFLLGDTGSANLATATATQRPLDIQFSAYQQIWIEHIEQLGPHIARWSNFGGNARILVDPPSIIDKSPSETIRAFAELARSVPAVAAAPQVISMLLTDMGVDDVDGAMAVIEPLLGVPIDAGVEEALARVHESLSTS